MRRLIYAEQAIGKTVESVCGDTDKCIGLHFTDGTTVVWRVSLGYEDSVEFECPPRRPADWELANLGLMTREEYNQRREADAKRDLERREREELATLAHLTEKYRVKA